MKLGLGGESSSFLLEAVSVFGAFQKKAKDYYVSHDSVKFNLIYGRTHEKVPRHFSYFVFVGV
jgi:hypothetical protein